MTNTTLFNFNGSDIRTVKIDGEPWFVAADVCRAIGYAVKANGQVNVFNAVWHLHGDEHITARISIGPGAPMKLVTESGLYKLVMRSDKPQAKDFQNWVTKVVLPAIRKDGGYVQGEEHVVSGAMTEDELVFKAMEVMKRKVVRGSKRVARLTAKPSLFRIPSPSVYQTLGDWSGPKLTTED